MKLVAIVFAVAVAAACSSKKTEPTVGKESTPAAPPAAAVEPAAGTAAPDGDNPYLGLRSMILGVKSADIGVTTSADKPVVAALLEFPIDGGVVTIVAVADGAASIYLSTGGGFMGLGGNPGAGPVVERFLREATARLPRARKVTQTPTPSSGRTFLYVVTDAGVFFEEAPDMMTLPQTSPYMPLFDAAQGIVTLSRSLDDQAP